MTHRTQLGPAIGLAALAAGTTWVTLLSWRVLTSEAAAVTMPLFLLAIAVAFGSATARWMRVPAAVLVLGQVVISALWLLFVVTGSMLPTGATLAAFGDAFSAGLESARLYEAPVPPNVPPVHALLLVGGTLTLLAVDFLACTLRRVPLAGLVLLTAYSVPVSVTGLGTSWLIFVLVAAGFLAMLFIAHEEQVTRWGREVAEEDADPAGFGVRTGAVRGSALTIGTTATAMALALPVLIPTLDVALFDGQGPGTREIEVADPMVDLRRDLFRGEDVPRFYVTTPGERPTYFRRTVLTRFNGDTWTPGDRDIPETQVARGEMPPLDGVDSSVPREETSYRVRVGPRLGVDLAADHSAPRRHPGDGRLALRHLDDGLHQRRRRRDDGRQDLRVHRRHPRPRRDRVGPGHLRCRRRAVRLPRGSRQRLERRAYPRGRRHRRGPDPLPQGPGAPAVVPRGRRFRVRPRGGRGRRGR